MHAVDAVDAAALKISSLGCGRCHHLARIRWDAPRTPQHSAASHRRVKWAWNATNDMTSAFAESCSTTRTHANTTRKRSTQPVHWHAIMPLRSYNTTRRRRQQRATQSATRRHALTVFDKNIFTSTETKPNASRTLRSRKKNFSAQKCFRNTTETLLTEFKRVRR